MYQVTTATRKVASMRGRIRAVPGGTSASKTISILMVLIHLAQADKVPTLTSVVAESVPHLKRGAIRDFRNIMRTQGYWREDLWNATDSMYTFETGSQIEFFSADSGDKLRGARRDRLFINEANNVAMEAFDQLEVRTKDFIFIDWNPSTEFWYYTDVKTQRSDIEELTLTYLDNEALDKQVIESIEQRKNRKGWWQVYGLGQLGEVEGKIYKGWEIIDEIPQEARYIRRGMDFGFSCDPTAIIGVYKWNDAFILDEELFRKGLSNKQIADVLLMDESNQLVVADSAEPKSIAEISQYGVNITGCAKGKDSVTHGIQLVQDQRMFVTKRSVNVIKAYRNYMWMVDKDGKVLNKPDHLFSDAMDAVRYAISSLIHREENNFADYTREAKAFVNEGRPILDIGIKSTDYADYKQDAKRAMLDRY